MAHDDSLDSSSYRPPSAELAAAREVTHSAKSQRRSFPERFHAHPDVRCEDESESGAGQ